jgi:hypothetical protein
MKPMMPRLTNFQEGYVAGLKRAAAILSAAEPAPQTRCTTRAFDAAKHRLLRVLRKHITEYVTEYVPAKDEGAQ